MDKKRQYDLTYNEGCEGYNPHRYDSEPLGDKAIPESTEELQRQLTAVEARKVDGCYTSDADIAEACHLDAAIYRLSLPPEEDGK